MEDNLLHCLAFLAFCILLVRLAKPSSLLTPLIEFFQKVLNKNFNRN